MGSSRQPWGREEERRGRGEEEGGRREEGGGGRKEEGGGGRAGLWSREEGLTPALSHLGGISFPRGLLEENIQPA